MSTSLFPSVWKQVKHDKFVVAEDRTKLKKLTDPKLHIN